MDQQPQQGFQGPPQQQYYPQQPMMPMQKKKHTGRNIFIGCGGAFALVVVIIIIFVATSINANKSTNTGTVVNLVGTGFTRNPQGTLTTQSTFKVGQVVSVANIWQITILSAKTSAGSQFNTPQKAGDVFLVITIAVKNISAQSQNMSSIGQWSLQDSTGQKYYLTIDPDAGATLDGAVAAGRPLKGIIAYDVPKTIHSFTLSFQNDTTSTDQPIWDIAV